MNTIWYSLFWKEWHEHKWKLASIVAILYGTTIVALLLGGHDRFGLAKAMQIACIVPLAVFVGTAAAANERARGTMEFLEALPAPLWRAGVAKLAFGVLTLLIPAVLMIVPLYFASTLFKSLGIELVKISSESITGAWYFDGAFIASLMAPSIFLWTAAAGVNRKDEISAGAVGLAAIVAWWVLVFAAAALIRWWRIPISEDVGKLLIMLSCAIGPGGIFPLMGDEVRPIASVAVIASLAITTSMTALALSAVYVYRFGHFVQKETRSPRNAALEAGGLDWLSPPRRNALNAIAWKQFRESGPILIAGFAGIAGIILVVASNPFLYVSRMDVLAELVAGVIVLLGFGIALIVGVGVCYYDVGSQLNTFWRSRPINPDLWFWCKFLTGLIVLLAALYIPLVAVVSIAHSVPGVVLLHPDTMLFPMAHVAIFAAAAAMTCLVRHAVYAAILSIPLMYLGIVLVWAGLWIAAWIGWGQPPYELSERQVAVGLTVSFVMSSCMGWLAVRNDWGWKSRY